MIALSPVIPPCSACPPGGHAPLPGAGGKINRAPQKAVAQ